MKGITLEQQRQITELRINLLKKEDSYSNHREYCKAGQEGKCDYEITLFREYQAAARTLADFELN